MKKIFTALFINAIILGMLPLYSKQNAESCKVTVDSLWEAARAGDTERMRFLLDHGFRVNRQKEDGQTALHAASTLQATQLLIDYGADVNSKDAKMRTPLISTLEYAISDSSSIDTMTEKSKLLIARGADVNSATSDGLTPLHYAAEEKALLPLLKILLECGANTCVCAKPYHLTPLMIATRCSNLKAASLLLEKGGSKLASMKDSYGATANQYSFFEENIDIEDEFSALFSMYPLVEEERIVSNWYDNYCTFKDIADFKKFMEREPDALKLKNYEKSTALHFAVDIDSHQATEFLLKVGAEAGALDDKGRTPLHFAQSPVTICRLLENKVDINAQDIYGYTPFMYILNNNFKKPYIELTLEYLLEKGADVSITDKEGKTALHHAIIKKHYITAFILICYGANLYAKDKYGQTPLDMEKNRSHRCKLQIHYLKVWLKKTFSSLFAHDL